MDNYTALEIGLDYLPYWDEPTDISDSETSDSETSNELNNIDLPF
jgi:hypothetical protein